jgi:hypothetical protein
MASASPAPPTANKPAAYVEGAHEIKNAMVDMVDKLSTALLESCAPAMRDLPPPHAALRVAAR